VGGRLKKRGEKKKPQKGGQLYHSQIDGHARDHDFEEGAGKTVISRGLVRDWRKKRVFERLGKGGGSHVVSRSPGEGKKTVDLE